MHCTRCGAALGKPHASAATAPLQREDEFAHSALPENLLDDPYWDGWRLEHELHDVEQMLANWRIDGPAAPEEVSGRDAGPEWATDRSPSPVADPAHRRPVAGLRVPHEGEFMAWVLLLAGILAAVAAALQAAASWSLQQTPPWPMILQCAVIGQALVLMGMVGHLRAAQQRQRSLEQVMHSIERTLSTVRREGWPRQVPSRGVHRP